MSEQRPLTTTLVRTPTQPVPLASLAEPQRRLICALLEADKAATMRRVGDGQPVVPLRRELTGGPPGGER